MLFSLKHEIGVKNFLHIAKILIALPSCKAESEKVFSFLWHAFSKEHQLLKHNTLEDILRLRSNMDFKPSNYAMIMPLNCFCLSILMAMLGREVTIWTDTIIPKNEKSWTEKKAKCEC